MIDKVCISRLARAAFAVCLLLPTGAGAQSFPRQRAGEWVTQIAGGGAMRRTCLHQDLVMDQSALLRRLQMMHGAQCSINDLHTLGPATTYSVSCLINHKVRMTSHETMTMVGPDAYQTKGFVHFDAGQMHDMTTDVTSRRTGPCQPGDLNF